MAYATVADVRARSTQDAVGDAAEFADAVVEEGIAYATALVEDYCGTSFESRSHSLVLDGTGTRNLLLKHYETGRPLMYPRAITACTIDGVTINSSEYDTWKLHPHGELVRPSEVFPTTHAGQNITLTVDAYRMTAPTDDLLNAICLVARDWVLNTADRTHRRALQQTDNVGLVVLAQPGIHGPSGIPQADNVLKRYKVRHKGFA